MLRRGLVSATVAPALILAAGCSLTGMVDRFTGEDVNREIREVGLPARATVLDIWETGVQVNDDPVVGFRLRIEAEGRSPWEAETRALVSVLDIPRIQPGAELPVLYDPADQSRVAIGTDDGPSPDASLPDGFRMTSFAEDNDFSQISRIIFRGFNNGDEPPATHAEAIRKMQTAPNYRKDLNIAIVSPEGNFIAYAGTWFEPENGFAYVEPVCTDPDYRRMGLARTALFEGIRRCGEMGAVVAYVGSALPIYRSMGFKKLYTCNCWAKNLEN